MKKPSFKSLTARAAIVAALGAGGAIATHEPASASLGGLQFRTRLPLGVSELQRYNVRPIRLHYRSHQRERTKSVQQDDEVRCLLRLRRPDCHGCPKHRLG